MNKDKKAEEPKVNEKVEKPGRKKLKPTAAFYGLICVIIGIIDLVNPEKMLNIIAYALGISAIICGLVFIIVYVARDVKYNLNNNDFLSGLIAVVVGIVILIKWQQFMELVPIVLGVLIIVSGCIKLQDAIDLKKLDHPAFLMMLIVAIVFIIFGSILVANPFKSEIILMRIIGVSLIIAGMTDLFTSVFFDGIRKSYQPETIETTYEEAEEKK
ncbi:MAG: DUF308 domain-containing protein [Lachnospiraceae bacterium]|nr:DUF308 domain-containing protein [Lachnospiraceae bacterium]MBO7530321.1 DUF308 domain-containing protein [Lachnospiraceae bacterium]MBP5252953.1 DUF308 domain-containing protein [Lachnospiraceae bacterium]MBP5471828.1 DUF308 domain-containing protein [Lachnospiraceae bacterium]MBP5702466.1 DUF308 domain-containing protein [Lachnospiraceae bacterium]